MDIQPVRLKSTDMIGRKSLRKEMKDHDVPERLRSGPAALFLKKGNKVRTIDFTRCGRLIIARSGRLKLPLHIYLEKEFL